MATFVNQQWENENLNTAFPFNDDSLPYDFPKDVVVDAGIVIKRQSMALEPFISLDYLHVGKSLASVVISSNNNPILHVHVLPEAYEPFTPVRLKPFIPGCSGFITFGDLATCSKGTWRSQTGIKFADTVVSEFPGGSLLSFAQPDHLSSISGEISFDLQNGVTATVSEDEPDCSIVSFQASDELRSAMVHPCDNPRDADEHSVPIRQINGIAPDKYGRIMIHFTGTK